jgi:hypothetical protein
MRVSLHSNIGRPAPLVEPAAPVLEGLSGASAGVSSRMVTRFLTRPRSNESAGNRMNVASVLLRMMSGASPSPCSTAPLPGSEPGY